MKQKDHSELTETARDGLVLTCVCGNRVPVLSPGVRAHPTWATDGLQCSNCWRMHAVLAGGEIFRYPRSEEEYQEVAKHWQLTDDFKALLVANLRNPTDARIDAVLDWAHRICFGGVSREDIAKGSVAMEQVLFDLVVDRKIAIVDLRDGQPVFEALRRDPTWR